MSAQRHMTTAPNAAASQAVLASAILARGGKPAVGAVMRFGQDSEIYGEGDRAEVYFKVMSGVVRTCKFLNDGRRQVDAFYLPGDVFGFEVGAQHSLTAEAVCDCTLVAHRWRGMNAAASMDADASSQLLGYAMHGLARAREHALLLGRKSAVEKVVSFLLAWARHSARGDVAVLAMTRQDIADYLGLTVETVSRTLSQLERDGLIDLPSARQIMLTDIDALRDLDA